MNILDRPALAADHRVFYGRDASQFGDLWLPQTKAHALCPLVVFYHGGWWKSRYDLKYASHLCAALKRDGIAVWSLEYRRVGATGGGWPMTFEDAAAGFDFIETLSRTYPLDVAKVITMGHSAGGHLAFWVAGRHHVRGQTTAVESSLALPVRSPTIPLIGSIGLAGAIDLRLTIDLAGWLTFAHDKQEVYNLMGGGPLELPDRYRLGNPGDLLPLNVPQILIQGSEDDQIPPELPMRWIEMSRRAGDAASYVMLDGADHFDLVDPQSKAWPVVLQSVRKMIFA